MNAATPSPAYAVELEPLRDALVDPDRLVRAVGSGRRRGAELDVRRVEVRWVELRGGLHLQIESFDDRQSFTRNVTPAAVESEVAALLAMPFATWHLRAVDAEIQSRVTKRGNLMVHCSVAAAPAGDPSLLRSHDRPKQRRADAGADYLRLLGVTTADGEVRAKRRDKLAQIEAFLGQLDAVVGEVAGVDDRGGDPLRVVDLGCGNAYLTFAAYDRLTGHHGLAAELVGIDTKAQAREHNGGVAAELGWADHVSFVESTIADAELDTGLDTGPDVVLALHACDTATDDALARAVRWQAPVVLAAPCCHHDLQRQLRDGGRVPHPYGALVRHGIVRERFADTLTDALRASVLRLCGYRVDVVEFVDSTHTPRNSLIRAVHTGAAPTPEQVAEHADLVSAWGLRPALSERLADLLPPGTGR